MIRTQASSVNVSIVSVAVNIFSPCMATVLWTHVLARQVSIVHGSLSSQSIAGQRSTLPASMFGATLPHELDASSTAIRSGGPILNMSRHYQTEIRMSTDDTAPSQHATSNNPDAGHSVARSCEVCSRAT